MTARPAFGTGGSVVQALHHRLAQAGLVSGAGVLTGLNVTPTAPASMSVQVSSGVGAVPYVGQGVYLEPNDALVTVGPLAAAPGSGLRYDVICMRQRDFDLNGVITASDFHVVQGASGSAPSVPAVPDGSLSVGVVRVSAGAITITSGVINLLGPPVKAVARGAPIPVSSKTGRDALTVYEGLQVMRLDMRGRIETYALGVWTAPPAGLVATVRRLSAAGPVTGMTTVTGLQLSYNNEFSQNRILRLEFDPQQVIVNAPSAGQVRFIRGGATLKDRTNSISYVNVGVAWSTFFDYSAAPGLGTYDIAIGNFSGGTNSFTADGPMNFNIFDLGAA